MSNPFLERLQKGPILCDGAMGTLLYSKGISYEHCFDEQNLSNPKMVLEIHQEYIQAGAEIIETNTFGANRFRLENYGFENKVRQINLKGAKIVREAREIEGQMVFVAGSIGPLGKPLVPLGKITQKEAREAFKEQAEALLEGGIDLFMIETMSELNEIKEAILAIREICELPIVAQMTFSEDGKTFMGNTPQDIVKELEKLEVDVIGANCSVGPQKMLDIISAMAEVSKTKLSAQPNAGLPRFVNGRFIYLSSPDYFAEYAKRFVQSGARVVGGCCGTTPQHIKAVFEVLKQINPEVQAEPYVKIVEERKEKRQKEERRKVEPSFFAARLGKEFLISVEVDPPRGVSTKKILESVKLLYQSGIRIVNIADSPMARVRMSCSSLAYLIKEQIGTDIILHFTCRDRNIMGLQADLIGVHALGIKNILAVTGDPPSLGDYPYATAVYDVDSVGLVKIINKLNQGTDWAGNSIGHPTNFCIGVAVNPTSENPEEEISRFKKKVEAGAEFAFTQPLYDVSILEKFQSKIKDIKIPVFLGVLPLHSYKHAQFMHHEVPGINIPKSIRKRMQKAGEKSAEEGVLISRELLKDAKGMVSGIYLMPSFGRFEKVLEVVEGI